ncbi:uncharacterized protein LOC105281852 [Ooceraea biroi]|uniref:Uncharacterized protein n=2 Tax=Ooceraea biroi TaxID=2015173 RepID=A0A026W982_OOCBI|nr:uncharacterized protein LOC105281852 [Ooceraea biroi]EZA52548.1 hypothetical protein X777_08027 [Ooceraea biroi]
MLETGRRSAISTSELGLYSDRGDRYSRSRYGLIARKLAIGVMVVVTVILVAIFMYDFTSATSGNSKINQETKHIYILQNALKKSPNLARKSANSTIWPEAMVNRTDDFPMEDRSDDENYENLNATPMQRNVTEDMMLAESRIVRPSGPEMRAQNLQNFKQRKRMLKAIEDIKEEEESEAKQFDNHAVVYRMRQRFKHPDSDEDTSVEKTRPTPFYQGYNTPHPESFKRPRYPQLSQYRYPHSSRNIQDIIKYLANNVDMPHRGIKFTGVYVSPKKYDMMPDIDEMMSSSEKSEENETPSSYSINSHDNDPFYQYKPKHPADVNLLATSNVRFSPIGIHRYNPHYNSLYSRPLLNYNKPVMTDYDTVGSYSTNTLGKNRKPKPFSVMLDIYPITDITEQNKKTSWPRPQGSVDDYDSRRPQFNRPPPTFYPPPPSPQSIPLVALPSPTTLPEEEERQQMIFHLNLYPRKKNKLSRHDIIHRSESMGPDERQQFAKKIMSPLESIAKHLTVHSALEESKFEERNSEEINLPLARYQEINLDNKNENSRSLVLDDDSEVYPDSNNEDSVERETIVPSNHKLSIDEDYASTEKYEIDAQKIIVTTEKDCANCDSTKAIDNSKASVNGSIDLSKDIEGFQRFSHGLLRSD